MKTPSDISFLNKLEQVIYSRKHQPEAGSYTSQMFAKGLNRIAQKFGEEAVETIIAAKEDDQEDFLNECADLMYNFMVLLESKELGIGDVVRVLESRHK